MGRFTFRSVFVAALLVGVAMLASAQAEPGVGVVEFVQGSVRINGTSADFGRRVALGDWVETGPDGSVDIVFDNSNVLRLGPNTVASLSIGRSRQEVDLKYGTLSAVFDGLRTLSGRGTFDVRTPTTVGGVRGTSFFLRVLDRDRTYVCVCNGTLELEPHRGDSFLESAMAHSGFLFTQGADGTVQVEKAGELYHNSGSLNRVAETIGVTIPWGELPD